MLSTDALEANLRLDHELRGFELKPAGMRSDTYLFGQVTRACLGMGNLRDGGHVVIGIDDENPASMSPGLSDDELASWMKFDDVVGGLSAASDPPLHVEIRCADLSNGNRVVVITVSEFHEVPHICMRDQKKQNPNQWQLRKGAIYIRSRRKPETSEIANSGEMRELLDLAKEKALRSYVETAQRAGLELREIGNAEPVQRPSERYAEQRKDVW